MEYRAKQLAPWKLMLQRPRPVDQSLLLDFVSDLSITSFIASLKTFDTFSVTVAAGGAFLLKIITILSTGLFVLQAIVIETPMEMIASNDFGGPNTAYFNYDDVDRRPFSLVYGINNYSLPYPSGTTSKYAYQKFNASQRMFKIPVKILTCELTRLSFRIQREHHRRRQRLPLRARL